MWKGALTKVLEIDRAAGAGAWAVEEVGVDQGCLTADLRTDSRHCRWREFLWRWAVQRSNSPQPTLIHRGGWGFPDTLMRKKERMRVRLTRITLGKLEFISDRFFIYPTSKAMLKLLRLAAICVLTGSPLWAAPSKLDLKDGDRVLLIGDTLMERENNYGYLEARMRQEFPGRSFAVRNLAYSGDSPLGASRASFDPVDKGVDSLKQQLAVVRPTVAILGYGMAASLEDLTYRQNDPVLNPDPARYGLDHSPAKFRRELLALMDLIKEASPGGSVRFVFVGPVRHEDMRGTRPGLPDPAGHNALLAEYEKVIEQLAAEKQSPFVRGEWKQAAGINLAQGTDNGIHLTNSFSVKPSCGKMPSFFTAAAPLITRTSSASGKANKDATP